VRLQRLKAFGFKTFAEPTVLDFSGGITAIVGPNGSGKSNLIDAFRWALGEQSSRSLRTGRMEGVIFDGTATRKPFGLAEVSLTFDNTDRRLPLDFSEIEITRRAYRAGEVEYYLNRNQCRLRDIVEMLMGTGLGPGSYAIVSQDGDRPTEIRSSSDYQTSLRVDISKSSDSDLPVPRAVVDHFGRSRGLSIFIAFQVPSDTGLGSSTASGIALIQALQALDGDPFRPQELAELACRIEIDGLGRPIGK